MASLAVDNDLSTGACTHWSTTTEPWLSIDLGSPMDVGRVCVTNDDHATGGIIAIYIRQVNAVNTSGYNIFTCVCVCALTIVALWGSACVYHGLVGNASVVTELWGTA